LIAGDVVASILDIALSPLGLLFWLIDSRFPCQSLFFKGCKTLLFRVIWIAILGAITWFLLSNHVGNSGPLADFLDRMKKG
jgi:hypothetical protein